MRGQRIGELRVKNGVIGDQREAHDGVLVMLARIGDHGCQRHLAAGAGGGGYGHDGGRAPQHAQDTLHLRKRFAGAGNARRHGLGAVHRGAAANGYHRIAFVSKIKGKRFFHLVNRGVGLHLAVHGMADARFVQALDQGRGKAVLHDALIGYHEHLLRLLARKHRPKLGARADDRGFAVGQEGERRAESELEDAAVSFFQEEHGFLSGAGVSAGGFPGLFRRACR